MGQGIGDLDLGLTIKFLLSFYKVPIDSLSCQLSLRDHHIFKFLHLVITLKSTLAIHIFGSDRGPRNANLCLSDEKCSGGYNLYLLASVSS